MVPAAYSLRCGRGRARGSGPDHAGCAAAEIVADLAIASCARTARGTPGDARAHFEYARALVAAGQPAAARSELEQAVSRGYRAARVDLARLLASQPSTTADAARAIALGERAWKDGDALAAFELGTIYERGVGRPGSGGGELLQTDEAAAWRWYRRGADALEPHALARVAELEETTAATATRASERDRHRLEAFKYYAAAAEAARREDWPDGAWRIWRLRRASLARLLALDGQMPQVASVFDAVRTRR